MTREEAEAYIGKYCAIAWVEPDGSEGGMEGEIITVDAEGYVCVDWGYGVHYGDVSRITVLPRPTSMEPTC